MKISQTLFLFFLAFFVKAEVLFAQVVPFEQEVKAISERIDNAGWEPGGIVFTGSSSIRFWQSLEEEFPNRNIINTGFGGSKASDLEKHLFPLVIRFEPKKVFIYEGDNDIWADVNVSQIMESLDNIVSRIQVINPYTEVVLISAKPSPSRWSKKENYVILNQMMAQYAQSKEQVEFLSVWDVLLDENGNPRPELYIQDQLHLNAEGYKLWSEAFRPFLKN